MNLEDATNNALKNVYVTLPCKVLSIDNATSMMEVLPSVYDTVALPPIVKVPVFQLGDGENTVKIKTKVGTTIPVFFSQLDLSKMVASGISGSTGSKEIFNLTSAIALPFYFHSETGAVSQPEMAIEVYGNALIEGDTKIIGNLDVEGNVTSTQIIQGVSVKDNLNDLTNHYHTTQSPAKPLTKSLKSFVNKVKGIFRGGK